MRRSDDAICASFGACSPGVASVEMGFGHDVWLRKGTQRIETIDSVRLKHVLDFARETGQSCPTLEWLAAHPDGETEVDSEALIEEMQRLAQQRPPERLAPMLGLLRNDARRIAQIAAAETP